MRREAAKRKLERQQQRRVEQAKKRQRTVVITVVGVVVLVAALIIVLVTLPSGSTPPPADAAGTPTSDPAAAPTSAATPGQAVTPASIPTAAVALPTRPTPFPATVSCAYKPSEQAAKPNTIPAGTNVSAQGTTTLTLNTNDGAIPMTLDKALAPCTVNSMVSLATQGYFNDTVCHRLTTDAGLQVLQCGDPTGQGTGGPGYTVPDEVFPTLTYGRGLLAMANTGQPDTGGSQFFIVYGDAQLPPQYTVFGSISPQGLQVVDTIAKRGYDKSTEMGAGGGTPIQPVKITTATVS
jgi:peptidyl-prolyl cis-trans isomerase B (cyclophilin B)